MIYASTNSTSDGPMTTRVDINEIHRNFWQQRQTKIDALLANPRLTAIVTKREVEKARFVHLATSEAVRIERIRNQKPFESELESTAEEYASLPYIEAQRRRASRPRGKVTDDGKTLNQVIELMVSKPEYQFLSTPELWPHLFDILNQLLLDPEEIASTNLRKSNYTYEFNDKRKRITYGRFANLASEYRNKVTLAGLPKLRD
jgi:hypothetical protein